MSKPWPAVTGAGPMWSTKHQLPTYRPATQAGQDPSHPEPTYLSGPGLDDLEVVGPSHVAEGGRRYIRAGDDESGGLAVDAEDLAFDSALTGARPRTMNWSRESRQE